MLKKVFVVGAAGLLVAAVLTQTKVGNVAWGWIDRCERHIDSKIKPEDEIRRIKKEVSSLDKDVDKAKRNLAEEIVEVRNLTKETDRLRLAVENSRKAVEARRAVFAGDDKFVKWDGRTINVATAKDNLAREVATHKHLAGELKAQEEMLAIHERSKTLAEQHLQALITEKANLEKLVTDVEANIKLAKIEQVESKYQNDGTRMAKVKKDLAELQKKLDIQRETLKLTKKISPREAEDKTVDEIFAGLEDKDPAQVTKK
jgi:peptidoglycan hydrolase CwlO-like protein